MERTGETIILENKTMTLKELQREVTEWSRRNFPDGKPYQPLLGVAEEVGELCHAHLKQDQGIRGYDDLNKAHREKMDAIGDIVIYLADYCHRQAIDFQNCVDWTWEKVKERKWTKEG